MVVIDMEFEKIFAQRLSALRTAKKVSARDMSLSLGQSEGYINNIENENNFPSMTSFFYICEYLGVTAKEFFDYDVENPVLSNELVKEIQRLDYVETNHVLEIIKDINKNKKKRNAGI